MGRAKIIFGDQVLQDLTQDTVTPEVLMEGYTAHAANGDRIVGTATGEDSTLSIDEAREYELIKGKNEWDFSKIKDNSGSRTWAQNNDDTITVSASSEQSEDLVLVYQTITDEPKLSAGRHVLSGCPSGGAEGTYCLYIHMRNADNTAWGKAYIDSGSGVEFEIVDGIHYYIAIRVKRLVVVPTGGYTFSPMICTLDEWNKSHTYEPYYVPVKEYAHIVPGLEKNGAVNSLKYPYFESSSIKNDVIFNINEDGTVGIGGTATALTNLTLQDRNSSNFHLPSGRWYISGGINENVTVVFYRNYNGAYQLLATSTGGAVLSPEISSSDDLGVAISIANGTNTNNMIVKPMLYPEEFGDNVPFQPYAMTNRELTEVKTGTITATVDNYGVIADSKYCIIGRSCWVYLEINITSTWTVNRTINLTNTNLPKCTWKVYIWFMLSKNYNY